MAGLSNSGSSLLQAATFSVSKNLAERCRYLSSYADPVFGEGNIYEMLTELLVYMVTLVSSVNPVTTLDM